jgi:hypothetical protein
VSGTSPDALGIDESALSACEIRGSKTAAGGEFPNSKLGGNDQLQAALKSTWPPENSARAKSTRAPENSARAKSTLPAENSAPHRRGHRRAQGYYALLSSTSTSDIINNNNFTGPATPL